MTEILSPAGSVESFFAAVNGGADGVYLGLDLFSARKNAKNFTRDNLPYYINYAHLLGVKVYVALNTLVSDKELDRFFEYLEFCNDNGVDAVILQDVLLGRIVHEKFPDLPLHLSTQAGVCNTDGAIFARDQGFCRVVLARETPLKDVAAISKIIETEVFIQGALCTAFSGQCYLSSFAGNQSGNRGLCKQPCRKAYTLRSGEFSRSGYQLSLADLMVRDKILDLKKAGVSSFKIEGRMRKESYVYYATCLYKDIISGKNPSISPLTRTFNRGNYTRGLCFGQDENLISDKIQSHMGEVIGKISRVNGQNLTLLTNHKFAHSDAGKILSDGLEVGNFICQKDLSIKYQGRAKVGDTVTITTDTRLEGEISREKRLLSVFVEGRFMVGEAPSVKITAKGRSFTATGTAPLEGAKSSPLSSEEITKNLSKVDTLPLRPQISVETDGVFMARSLLNDLRRRAYDGFCKEITKASPRRKTDRSLDNSEKSGKPSKENMTVVISNDFADICDLNFEAAVFAPDDYTDKDAFKRFFDCLNGRFKTYLYLPGYLTSDDNGLIAPLFEKFDGIYADGYYGVVLSKRLSKPLILGSGANVYNSLSLGRSLEYTDITVLSKEVSKTQTEGLDGGYYYAGGRIKVMDLCYCPFKKTCDSCPYKKGAHLFDGERQFPLRRVKLSSCRFEVYNCSLLVTDFNGNKVFNLIDVDTNLKRTYLKKSDLATLKSTVGNFTLGHHNKPLE